jgi:CRP-like cAMP-binding protein
MVMKEYSLLLQAHFGPLSDKELEVFQACFHTERLQKNDFFTSTHHICSRLSLVKSGILRVYALSNGKEITQWICAENFLITEVMGFFFDQPNRWNIQAFTDVELLTITKENYRKLCDESPRWRDIEKRFMTKCFAMIENRVFSHLSMTAEERYDAYFEQNRALFNQVPLQYIASVLGMTAETFSRIRKRKGPHS